MADPWAPYRQVIVETYYAVKPGKSSKIHVRPVAGQGYPSNIDVECPREIRKQYPIGTKFKIHAKETNREGGKTFLYSHHSWPMTVVELGK